MAWFKLLAPVGGKLLRNALERVTGNLGTTKQGAVVGLALVGVLEGFGCHVPAVWEGVLAGVSSAPLLLATDPGKALPTLLEVMKSAAREVREGRTEGDTIHDRTGQGF